jgi:hypothetical protein
MVFKASEAAIHIGIHIIKASLQGKKPMAAKNSKDEIDAIEAILKCCVKASFLTKKYAQIHNSNVTGKNSFPDNIMLVILLTYLVHILNNPWVMKVFFIHTN